jgi:hypothetical protein
MATPILNSGSSSPSIVGNGSRNPVFGSNGSTQGAKGIHPQCLSQANLDTEETPIDSSISEYENVCYAFKEKTLLRYLVGKVPPPHQVCH